MRVLHVAHRNPNPGVVNQMTWEQKAADQLGLPWDSRLLCRRGSSDQTRVVLPIISAGSLANDDHGLRCRYASWKTRQTEFFAWLHAAVPSYDVILLRYTMYNPFAYQFVRNTQKPVFFVHHTLEVPELQGNRSALSLLLATTERFLGPLTLRQSSGIIAVTSEILEYELTRVSSSHLPVYVYPNGLLSGHRTLYDRRDLNTPTMIFVASEFAYWHGLDRIMLSLKENGEDFVLHIVGSLSHSQLREAEADPRVQVHGVLEHAALLKIMARCWVGLSSFALDRKGMAQACTLKVREYLAYGLPVYAGHGDIFPKEFSFFHQGPPDITQILNYAHAMKSISRSTVVNQSQAYIDKASLVRYLYEWLCKRVR